MFLFNDYFFSASSSLPCSFYYWLFFAVFKQGLFHPVDVDWLDSFYQQLWVQKFSKFIISLKCR